MSQGERPSSNQPQGDAARVRVLVVDDDPSLLRTFQRVFGRIWEVHVATSGDAALRLLETQAVDVAIVDYSMPGMSGIELLRRLGDEHPELAKLMLTAYADLPEVVALKDLKLASAVLTKPWERAEVEASVGRALHLQSMQRAVARMRHKLDRSG